MTFTDEQLKLIEKHRDINVCFSWYDDTIEDFVAMLAKEYGIEVSTKDVAFSGFYSQGDGASFTGIIRNDKQFLEAHGLADSYPTVYKYVCGGGLLDMVCDRFPSMYCHENTMFVSWSNDMRFWDIPPYDKCDPMGDDLRGMILRDLQAKLEIELTELEESMTEVFRDHARELYKTLEQEYDFLTSDQQVWEAIVACELDTREEDHEELQRA